MGSLTTHCPSNHQPKKKEKKVKFIVFGRQAATAPHWTYFTYSRKVNVSKIVTRKLSIPIEYYTVYIDFCFVLLNIVLRI